MKLSVDRKALSDATKAAARFLPSMAHIEVLRHLELEAHSNQLMVSATNLDSGRTVEVEADIETDGRILVPATFAQIAAKARGKVTLEATIGDVSISDGKSKWKLQLGKIEDYPEVSTGDSEPVEIESWSHIQHIAGFAGLKDNREHLQGVFFGDGMAVATDSYSIAWCDTSDTPEALVPAYAIKSLTGNVGSIGFTDRHATAVLEDGVWWSRLGPVEKFPKWRKLVDGFKPITEIQVATEVLDAALARALLVGERDHVVWLEIGDGITVFRTHSGETTFEEHVPADIDGVPVKMAFNPPRLRGIIAPVEKATLTIETPTRMLRVSGDGWFEAGLMPVRT